MIARRSFITGLAALIAAPAIVRAGSLMPVKTERFVLPDLRYRDYPEFANQAGLDVLYGSMRIGDVIRIRLPNDFVVSGQQFLVSEYKELLITANNISEFRNPADNALGLVPATT